MKNLLLLITLLFPTLIFAADYQMEVIAEELNHPWSIDFLPEGGYLVAMKSGEVHLITATGEVSDPIDGGPDTYFESQGGYFDILLDPDYSTNHHYESDAQQ